MSATSTQFPSHEPGYKRSRYYELWQRVEGGVNDAGPWMVWEVGPMSGAETWCRSEEEARKVIAEIVARREGSDGQG